MCQNCSMTKKSYSTIDGHLQKIYGHSQVLFACHTCIERPEILGPNIGNAILTMGFLAGATPLIFPQVFIHSVTYNNKTSIL